jgi:hypothetical protein
VHKPLPTFRDHDGRVCTVHDLPPASCRWTFHRKALIVKAIEAGAISPAEVCARYDMSPTELAMLRIKFQIHGEEGLKLNARSRPSR